MSGGLSHGSPPAFRAPDSDVDLVQIDAPGYEVRNAAPPPPRSLIPPAPVAA